MLPKNNRNDHSKIATAALILVMAFAILFAATPLSNAQNLLNHNTYVYVVAAPNPVGVGQTTYITYFLPNVPPAQYPLVAPKFGTWTNITLTITKPDGTTQIYANISTSFAGAGTIPYIPSLPGTYTLIASFAGQTIVTGPTTGQYYSPSTSPPTTLNVTTSPLPAPISYPLPTNYWTFPIEAQNQAWNIYSGNWLAGIFPNASMTSPWNPWTVGPYSAHVMWSQPWVTGGLVGGNYLSQNYYSGRWPGGSDQYFRPFIANGILYANLPQYFTNQAGVVQPAGFEAINLATGQVIWKNVACNDAINYLEVFNYGESTMATGTYNLLWSTAGSTWHAYDPLTGNLVQNVTSAPSGGKVTFGPSGELIIYYANANGWLAMWNSTYYEGTIGQLYGFAQSPLYAPNDYYIVPQGAYNFSLGYQWNITIPKQSGIGFTNGILPNDMLILSSSIAATNTTSPMLQQIAVSIKPNQYTPAAPNTLGLGAVQSSTGNQVAQVLWGPINRTTFIDNDGYERIETIGYANNGIPVYVMYSREKLQMVAYNAYTGANMYTTQPFENAFGMFTGESNNIQAADGKLFAGGYDGTMHCYDLATGNLLWEYYVGNAGLNTPYGTWVIDGSYSYYDVAGGMVIMGANEHSPNNPTWLGGQIWAVNETNGQLVWKIDGFQTETQPMAAADNQLVYLNYYDGKLYDIGKGPSATTISATSGTGNAVTLQGTVTDISTGTKQIEIVSNYPNGVPCASDNSMSSWMEYLYMQKPMPTDATGVPVTLSVFDPNNNTYVIGKTTSDIAGSYAIAWTPPVPGLYTITATFAGSNSYFGSSAVTHFNVAPIASAQPTSTVAPTQTAVPSSTPTQTAVSPSPSQAPQPTGNVPTMTYIAIAAAVVIIAVVAAAIALRRKK